LTLGFKDILKNEYGLNVIILSLLAFIVNLGFGAISSILPYFILYLEGSLSTLPEELSVIKGASEYAFEVGTLMSAFMFTRAFLARYFGIYSDKIGRKKIVSLGTILYAIVSFFYVIAPSIYWLYAIRMLQGVASAMVWPVAEALLMDSVSEDVRGRVMGVYMATTMFSFIGGPAIGVIVYKIGVFVLNIKDINIALRFPFILLALLSLIAVFTVARLKDVTVSKNSKNQQNEGKVRLLSFVKRSINTLYAISFSNGVAMGLISPIVSLYIVEYITSDPAAIAIVSFISGLAGFLVTYPAGYLSDKIGRRKIIIAGILGSRTATLLIPFTKTVEELTAVATLRNINFNFYTPAFRALQADLVPQEIRGKIFGTVQMFFNLGAVIGPILGGAVYQAFANQQILGLPGVAMTFLISALIGYVSLLIFILYVKDEKPASP